MRTVTAVIAGVAVAVVGLWGGKALSRPAAEGGAVAVVDLNRVLKSAPQAKRFNDGIQKKAEEFTDALAKRAADLKKQLQDIDVVLDPASKEYAARQKAIRMGLAEIDYDKNFGMDRIVLEQVKGKEALYRDICAEASRIAEAKGFTCLLNRFSDPIVVQEGAQAMTSSDLNLQIATRSVLWNLPGNDITQDVIDALRARDPGTDPGNDPPKDPAKGKDGNR